MITLLLTRGQVALISDHRNDLAQFKWTADPKKFGFYAVRNEYPSNRKLYLHRVVLSLMLGRQLERWEEVDHVDLNKLNCQDENLRLATDTQNHHNTPKHKNCSSRFKGVSWYSRDQKWESNISVEGRTKKLGKFLDEIEAARAYDRAALKYFGEFARTNVSLGLLPPEKDKP